jgi:hypothetical protein
MTSTDKYSNGKIYKITNNVDSKCYIGSTIQSLNTRMTKHKNGYKKYKEVTTNKCMNYDLFDEYGFENCKIELIEIFPCTSKEELERREGELIQSIDCVNRYVAGRTKKEYEKDNKETITLQKKEYYEKNKESINLKNKEYAEKNKEHIKEWKKEWKEENKESIAMKSKDYYEKNKERIALKKKEYNENTKHIKVKCECGVESLRKHLSRHKKSKFHQDFMNSKL